MDASRLVVLEQHQGHPPQVRPLFGRIAVALPAGGEQAVDVIDGQEDRVPASDGMRYVVWKALRSILPSCGPVLELRQQEARVALGSQHGIHQGQRLRVWRPQPDGSYLPLATTLTVQQTQEASCWTLAAPTGVEGVWPDLQFLLQGDIAAAQNASQRMPAIRVRAFSTPKPTIQELVLAGISSKQTAETDRRFSTLMEKVNQRIRSQVLEGISRLSLPTQDGDGGGNLRATHDLNGVVRISGSGKYDVTLSLRELNSSSEEMRVEFRNLPVPR